MVTGAAVVVDPTGGLVVVGGKVLLQEVYSTSPPLVEPSMLKGIQVRTLKAPIALEAKQKKESLQRWETVLQDETATIGCTIREA